MHISSCYNFLYFPKGTHLETVENNLNSQCELISLIALIWSPKPDLCHSILPKFIITNTHQGITCYCVKFLLLTQPKGFQNLPLLLNLKKLNSLFSTPSLKKRCPSTIALCWKPSTSCSQVPPLSKVLADGTKWHKNYSQIQWSFVALFTIPRSALPLF